MDLQAKPSSNVIDRRAAAKHGLAALLGILLGYFGRYASAPTSASIDADLVQVVSTSLDRGQDFWRRVAGAGYRDARVVLFTGREQTPCGEANSGTGPFYCAAGGLIFLDLTFLRAINGDLARAYVIAHELGHHVARMTGAQVSGVDAELLADCLAGEWMRSELDAGRITSVDVDAATAEAEAVGDDRICPGCSIEQWTHGSSAQRRAALLRGMTSEGCSP